MFLYAYLSTAAAAMSPTQCCARLLEYLKSSATSNLKMQPDHRAAVLSQIKIETRACFFFCTTARSMSPDSRRDVKISCSARGQKIRRKKSSLKRPIGAALDGLERVYTRL